MDWWGEQVPPGTAVNRDENIVCAVALPERHDGSHWPVSLKYRPPGREGTSSQAATLIPFGPRNVRSSGRPGSRDPSRRWIRERHRRERALGNRLVGVTTLLDSILIDRDCSLHDEWRRDTDYESPVNSIVTRGIKEEALVPANRVVDWQRPVASRCGP
jgi:hypothetical protein